MLPGICAEGGADVVELLSDTVVAKEVLVREAGVLQYSSVRRG